MRVNGKHLDVTFLAPQTGAEGASYLGGSGNLHTYMHIFIKKRYYSDGIANTKKVPRYTKKSEWK